MLGADYFSLHGHNFLVIADRFTGWNAIESTHPLASLTASTRSRAWETSVPRGKSLNKSQLMVDPRWWVASSSSGWRTGTSHTAPAVPASTTATAGPRRPCSPQRGCSRLRLQVGQHRQWQVHEVVLQYCSTVPPPGLQKVSSPDGFLAKPCEITSLACPTCITQELSEQIMAKSRELDGKKLARNKTGFYKTGVVVGWRSGPLCIVFLCFALYNFSLFCFV